MLKVTTAVTSIFLALSLVSNSQAKQVYLGPDYNSVLVVSFDAPVQSAANSAIWFHPVRWSGYGTVNAEIRLYDESGLLGQGLANDFAFGFFTDPANFLSGSSGSFDIDFSRIADGVTNGRFEFRVLGGTAGAFVSFESSEFKADTFGNQGGYPAFYPTITNVAWSTTAVPELSTFSLMALGLATVALLRRRRDNSERST